jgi:TfoX/Sxy family transcriptional regulator of competence genes
MPYNEKLADRTREIVAATHKNVEEKKMFGGLCFMVNDKMCVGVKADHIMVRIDPVKYTDAMEQEGCKPMVHGKKIMKAFLYVDADVVKTKKKLEYWLELALDYNKIAKASKKKPVKK